MKPPVQPGTPWTEHYETLRQHVLAGRAQLAAEPLGLGLVCRRGLAGWMGAWRQASAPPAEPLPLPARGPVTAGWHRELTLLLAQMTAPHLPSLLS